MGANNVVGYKPPKGIALGEVAVQVLKYQADPVLEQVTASVIYIACPNTTTTGDLRRRVHGLTGIPEQRIRLMLCGAVLRNDGDLLPSEAFEETQRTTDDADIFRPRIYMSLQPVVEEAKPPSIISVVEEEEDEEEIQAALRVKAEAEEARRREEEIMAIREARTKALEEQLMLEHVRPADFDLSSDLEKIQCSAFIQPLRKAGFADEGAFAHITDETLHETGLWIPRKARVRIVALADSVKRRLEVRDRSGPGALAEVEKSLVTGGKMNTRGLEGVEENFRTKAQATKAFEKKVREEKQAAKEAEERAKQAEEEEKRKREPRLHDRETQLLIDHIRWRCTKDEFGLPVHCFRPEAPKFCCQKHEAASIEKRAAYLTILRDDNLTDLTVKTHAADTLKRGLVSREALKVIALTHVRERDYQISEHEIESLLDECMVTAAQQQRLGEWGREIERLDNPLGIIPAPFYDTRRFIDGLTNLLTELDRVRYLSIERPFTVLPYPKK